jgi:hypothetical protein
MANPLYGQNKADDFLDALANADDNIAAAGTTAGSAGETDGTGRPAKVLPVTIAGVVYYIGLWDQNT